MVKIAESVINVSPLENSFTYYVTNEYKLYRYIQRPQTIKHLSDFHDITPSYIDEKNVLIEKDVKSIKTFMGDIYILDVFGNVWIAKLNKMGFIKKLNLLNIVNCKKLIYFNQDFITFIDNRNNLRKYDIIERTDKILSENILDKDYESLIKYTV